MYKLVKSSKGLTVRYTASVMVVILIVCVLIMLALIYRSFSDPSAINGFWPILFITVSLLTVMESGTFIFDKTRRILSYRTRGPFFRLQNRQIPFDEIKTINLEQHRDSDGDGYRIILRCEGMSLPLAKSFTAKEPLLECFKQIHEIVLNKPPAFESYASEFKVKKPTEYFLKAATSNCPNILKKLCTN